MGLFDWNESRNDYGRDDRAGGRGESLGDRMRGAWHRFEERMGGGPQRGYDRDPGYRGGARDGYDRGMVRRDPGRTWNAGGNRGYDAGDFAYRGMDGAWSTAYNRGAHDSQWDWRAAGGSRYDQDLGGRAQGGYDRGHGAQRAMRGYDRDTSGRETYRTDAGDPYGDRQRRTPFRVLRGGFDTEETDRGGWMDGSRLNQQGGGRDPYGVRERGWNRGIGDEPMYRPEDFRGRGRGR